MVFAALALPGVAPAALVWETREVTLIASATDREIVAHYPFKNTGARAVAILDVVSSCDCTTTAVTRRVLAPGETGALTARLAVGGRSGLQENTIAVLTDDAGGEPTVLRLRAHIASLVSLSAPLLHWSVGAEPVEAVTIVAAAGPLRIASLAVTEIHPADAAGARVETLDAGLRYQVRVRPATTNRTANFAVSCSVRFTDGTSEALVVHGMVRK